MLIDPEFRNAVGIQLSVQEVGIIKLVGFVLHGRADLKQKKKRVRKTFLGLHGIEIPQKDHENPLRYFEKSIKFSEDVLHQHALNEKLEAIHPLVKNGVYTHLVRVASSEISRARKDEEICAIYDLMVSTLENAGLDETFRAAKAKSLYDESVLARAILRASYNNLTL